MRYEFALGLPDLSSLIVYLIVCHTSLPCENASLRSKRVNLPASAYVCSLLHTDALQPVSGKLDGLIYFLCVDDD